MGDGKKNKSVADPAPGPIPSQPGEVVWAKIPGYPFWPARIAATTEVSPSIRNLKKSDTPYFVFFFGSHDYAWVKDKQICPWDPKYEGIKKNKTKTFQRGMEELNAWTSQDLSKRLLPTYTKDSRPSSDEEGSAEESDDEEEDESENTGASSDGSSTSKKKRKKKKKKPIYVPLPSPVRSPTFVKDIENDDEDSLLLSDDSNNITTNATTSISPSASSSSSAPKPGNLSGSSDSAQSDSSGSNPKRKKLSSSSFQSYYANMLNKSTNSPKFGESSMMEGSFEDSASSSFPVTSLGTSEVLNASDSFAPLTSHPSAPSRSTNGKANLSASSSSHSASLSGYTSSFSAAASSSSSTVNPYKARTSSSYGESAPPNLAIEGWEEDELEVISSLYDADEQAMEQVLPAAKPKSKSKSRSSIDTDTAQPMDEGSDDSNTNVEHIGDAEKENTPEDKRNENELTRTSTALNESLDSADDEGDEEEEEDGEEEEGGRGRASDLVGLSKRERLRRRWLELPLERRRFIRRRYQQRQRRNRLLRKLGLAPPIFLPAKGIFL